MRDCLSGVFLRVLVLPSLGEHGTGNVFNYGRERVFIDSVRIKPIFFMTSIPIFDTSH